jgi:UDP-glucose:(heptosyl)LPS alpha-1,3-glucosyltransferase
VKVALVAEWLDAWRGGAEASTQQFMHHLMERGVDLHVFTRSRPSPTPHLHVHTIAGASMSRTRQSMTFAHRVEALVHADSFDVIHAISPCVGADIYQPRGGTVAETIERNLATRRTAAARSLKRFANSFNFKQRYMLALERKILGEGDGPIVVAISDYVVRQLKEHYRLSDERIRKIYNGVDHDASTDVDRVRDRESIRGEFRITEDDHLVLLVAHNFRLKGVQRWMEALALLQQRGISNIRSLVIGKGDSRKWHRLAVRLGIDKSLTFTGPSDRVSGFLHAADALVHPTYYDPCSRVVLEAVAAGLPCITTRWDGASEVVENGVNGYVVDDPWNVQALADAVVRLQDGGLRRDVAAKAAGVSENVGMERHAVEMLALYDELQVAAGVPA